MSVKKVILTTALPGMIPQREKSGWYHWFVGGAILTLRSVTPGWFTSVMGTGILAICMTLSPVTIPGLKNIAIVLWSIDACLLALLLLLWLAQGLCYPGQIRASLHDPAHAQLWGAPPMACFTVSTGFLVIGTHILNASWCIHAAQGLWLLGVAGSIFSALVVPYLMFTHHDLSIETTYGSWLLPVVPPIVASVPGALLASTWPLALRSNFLALSYVLWGIGIALAAIIIVLFYARLAYHNVPTAMLVPTLWIVVGPLGQSVAGINALGNATHAIWPTLETTLRAAGLVYGLPVWGFGMYWLVLAILVTIRAARTHLPFNLGWWAFTFPVGVLTTGTYALYARTQTAFFAVSGILLLCLLALMWTLVATHTLRHILATTYGTLNVATSVMP